MNWEPLQLASTEFDEPPTPPDIGGLLYLGMRHAISGPPESIKTVGAWILALEHLRAGNKIAVIDFEMGPKATKRLLLEIGFTLEEIRESVLYYESPGEPTASDIVAVIGEGVSLVVIDAAAGAYDASGLDDNKRQDAERFAGLWVNPLFEAGITTVILDHVTKSAESRGKFMIGSERKLGGVDVHLGLELVGQPLTRGGSAIVKVKVHKDRGAYLARPVATELHIQSDPETHQLTWEWKAPMSAVAEGDEWRPTIYMERISRHLEEHGPMSRTAIQQAGLGKTEYLTKAVNRLITDGNVTESHSRLIPALPFRAIPAHSPIPKPFPAIPEPPPTPSFPHSPRLQGGEGEWDGMNDTQGMNDEAERLTTKHSQACRRCGGSYVRGTGNQGDLCPDCAKGEVG